MKELSVEDYEKLDIDDRYDYCPVFSIEYGCVVYYVYMPEKKELT
jgi:hypothetical protein